MAPFSWPDWESCINRHKSRLDSNECLDYILLGSKGNPKDNLVCRHHTHAYITISLSACSLLQWAPCSVSLLPSFARDVPGNLGCFNFGLTQTRPDHAEAACPSSEQRAPPGITQGWLLGCHAPAGRGNSLFPSLPESSSDCPPSSSRVQHVGEEPLIDKHGAWRTCGGSEAKLGEKKKKKHGWGRSSLKWKGLVESFEWNEVKYTTTTTPTTTPANFSFCLTRHVFVWLKMQCCL